MMMQKGLKKYFVNMDEYLSSLGLYRKMMARDASCLFRAVSEQLYYSQSYHLKIRRACANFMSANRANFEPFVEGSFEKYLERLVDPKETAGQVEIKALSQLYSRCFHIYRYPGKQPTVINEDDYEDKLMLCCSNNGHYDIVYPRSYPTTAALCQSLLYEMLYTRVLGVEGVELHQALEAFRVGGRRYRNSPSACSDGDAGEEWDSGGPIGSADDKARSPPDDKPLGEQGPPPLRLSLPYKVLKSLDGELYRNLEFDVWHESRKEMQKTDYMVFAGRQYFLGDKCQVRLEPKGKYYNAFIQEVGTHTSAVTVFIEELGEKHLVPLAHLKPVNPVPAWNVTTPTRKGELEVDGRGQRHRHRYFRKSRGGKGAELVLISSGSYGGRPSSPSQPALPPRFQPGPPGGRPGMHPPPPSPGAMTYDPYAPHHHHHHHHHHPGPSHPGQARPPRYGAPRSSVRFMNRHLIGPQLAYYHPGRRYYHGYDNYSFRSRRSRRQIAAINKDCQFGFPGNPGEEESQELEGSITYYHLEEGGEAVFPPLTGQAVAPPPPLMGPPPPHGPSYWVQRGSGGPGTLPSSPPHPAGKPPVTSSEEEPEDTSTLGDQEEGCRQFRNLPTSDIIDAEYSEEYIYASQDADFQSPVVYASNDPNNNLVIQEDSQTHYNYTQQVVKPTAVLPSSPSSSSSSSSSPTSPTSHLPPPAHSQPRPVAMAIPAPSPWLVNEMGEPVATVMAPPPYSYDPNGTDLPRDYRILQYYFNLGVQWCHQNSWQQVYPAPPPPDTPYHYQAYPAYLGPAHSQEVTIHATAQPGPHQPPPYPESTRAGGDGQTDGHANGHALSLDCSTPVATSPVSPSPPGLLYQEQPMPIPPLSYDPPPGPAYLTVPPPHPHHHSAYFMPPAHWGGAVPGGPSPHHHHSGGGPHPRLYCPAPSHAPSHMIGYIAAGPPPAHHASATHYMP